MSNTVVTTDTVNLAGRTYPSSTQEIAGDAAAAAAAVGLTYVVDDWPGIRGRRGKVSAGGRSIIPYVTRALALSARWPFLPPGQASGSPDGWDTSRRRAGTPRTKAYRYHQRVGEHRSAAVPRIIAWRRLALSGRVGGDLTRRACPKVIATAVRLLEMTFIRIGNKVCSETLLGW
jgi:hypothetical protein